MKNWLPIQKVLTGALAAGLLYAARRLHLVDFGDAQANEAAQSIVALVVAYLWPDPRVRKLEAGAGLAAKLRWLLATADAAVREQAAATRRPPPAP